MRARDSAGAIDASLLLGLGMSERAAARASSAFKSVDELGMATELELAAIGVPAKTAARMAAAFAVGRRAIATQRKAVGRAVDVYEMLRPLAVDLAQEVFWVICIDVRNGMIGQPVEIARGHVSGVEVHPREVFRPAVRAAAAAVILAHNHPSGDPYPSNEDVQLTHRLREAGTLIGIPVIDHVVVAASGYRSISELCLL